MKRLIFTWLFCFALLPAFAQKSGQIPTIYVDRHGVMRWSDTKEEASFFGVNYTLPFAHAYRAIGYLGMDRKQAIDRDVYHLARLGINAYRIHLWDVELSDERGNLLENEHLELMDYLLARLEERGIRIIITLQTNFGNGYPERNEPTGGYSYLYDKCSIHRNPEAIAAQERYVAALVNHVNCYTDCSYKEDPYIVGFEINNEPCHTGTVEETEAYINRMLRALKRAGNCKPVFYNVSHNGQVVEAYYATDIQGTTYQWYPTGLVSGHTRRGNCLPAVEKYDIPFSDVKGFDRKARLVYEFDPADVLYTYMYPVTVRTLRTAGFQWITQFAYDPIDMAAYNTEYQTHYLNTAYTPGKAVGLMIAAEVARTVQRGEQFAPYPADTLFRDFRVSHTENLTELNDGEKFYYSNCTRTQPKDASRLRAVAGCGSSPVVRYEGTGLYWLDRLEPGVWRLEVMPDVVQTADPFAKPSLDRKAIQVVDGAWNLTVNLPDLGHRFRVSGLNEGNIRRDQAVDGTIPTLTPGVYLLQREDVQPSHTWRADTTWRNIRLGEYVRPLADHTSADGYLVRHEPLPSIDVGRDLTLTATVAGGVRPDSVLIYTDKVSFWNDTNPYVKMRPAGGYTWQAIIPADELQEGTYRYNLVVCAGNHRQTFPVGTDKSPLDWDYTEYTYWQTEVQPSRSPLLLLDADALCTEAEVHILPEWSRANIRRVQERPVDKPTARITFCPNKDGETFFVRRYVKDLLRGRTSRLADSRTLCLRLNTVPDGLQVALIASTGYTYATPCPDSDADGVTRIPLSALKQTDTALLPRAYPSFLDPYFHPEMPLPFRPVDIESLELRLGRVSANTDAVLEVGEVWLE